MAASPDDGQEISSSATALAPSAAPTPLRQSFFDLPIELRLKVYETLFCFLETIMLKLNRQHLLKHDSIGGNAIPVHALRLSKQIYKEASPILYNCNKFGMNSAFFPCGRNWKQPICSLLTALELRCVQERAWGYVDLVKTAADKMPSLRKLELQLRSPYQLLAAALEVSNAITPCAPMFDGPELHLYASFLENGYIVGREEGIMSEALLKPNSKLSDIQLPPDANPLTHSIVPQLFVIRLTGKIPEALLRKLDQHTCLPGSCTWVKTGEEKQDHADEEARGSAPQVNMLQWYPELSKSDQKTLAEFINSFNGDDASSGYDSATPSEHESTTRHGENRSDDTSSTPVNDDDFETTKETAPTALETTDLDETLQYFRELPLCDQHDQVNGEYMHKNPDEVEAAWEAQFGVFARDFGAAV